MKCSQVCGTGSDALQKKRCKKKQGRKSPALGERIDTEIAEKLPNQYSSI